MTIARLRRAELVSIAIRLGVSPRGRTVRELRELVAAKLDCDPRLARVEGWCQGCSGRVEIGHVATWRDGRARHAVCDPDYEAPERDSLAARVRAVAESLDQWAQEHRQDMLEAKEGVDRAEFLAAAEAFEEAARRLRFVLAAAPSPEGEGQ